MPCPPASAMQAASLGVPRGPLFGKLVKGEEVMAANGQVVRPADVMEPATPGEATQHRPPLTCPSVCSPANAARSRMPLCWGPPITCT